jgi:hypothetical protein
MLAPWFSQARHAGRPSAEIVRGELDRSSTTMRCQAAVPEPGHFAGFNRAVQRLQGLSGHKRTTGTTTGVDILPSALQSLPDQGTAAKRWRQTNTKARRYCVTHRRLQRVESTESTNPIMCKTFRIRTYNREWLTHLTQCGFPISCFIWAVSPTRACARWPGASASRAAASTRWRLN